MNTTLKHISITLLSMLLFTLSGQAMIRTFDISTGSSGGTSIAPGSNDDDWFVKTPVSPSFIPALVGTGTYMINTIGTFAYPDSDPSAGWLQPYQWSTGVGKTAWAGEYEYYMHFSYSGCNKYTASIFFDILSADDSLTILYVNGHPHTVNAVFSPSGLHNYTITLAPNEIIQGINSINIKVKNLDNSYTGLLVKGRVIVEESVILASFNATSPCTNSSQVFFSASASFPCNPSMASTAIYSWNFMDGTTATGQNVNHVFSTPGAHTVILTVSSLSESKQVSQTIYTGGVNKISGNQLSLCLPATTNGSYHVVNPTPNANYTWTVTANVGSTSFTIPYTVTGTNGSQISIDWAPVLAQFVTLSATHQVDVPTVQICMNNTTCGGTTCMTLSGCCQRVGASDNFSAINFQNVTLVPYSTPGSAPFPGTTGFNQQTMTGYVAIPQSGIITKNMYIMGNLTVDANVTFSNSSIACNEAANVYVSSSKVVNINNSRMFGCRYMWEGITNYGDISVSNSSLSDANNAIKNANAATTAIKVSNTLFNRNQTSISLQGMPVNSSRFYVKGALITSRDFDNGSWTDQTTLSQAIINGSLPSIGPNVGSMFSSITMKGSPAMNIPVNQTTSSYGISVVNTPLLYSVDIGQPSSPTETNFFDNMSVAGLFLKNSRATVANNVFQNMFGTNLSNGSGILIQNSYGVKPDIMVGFNFGYYNPVSNQFNHLNNGIVATAEAKLTVLNNDFTDIRNKAVGISGWYSQNIASSKVLVKQNHFSECFYDFHGYNNILANVEISNNVSTYTPDINKAPTNVFINEVTKPTTAAYLIQYNDFSGKTNGIDISNTYAPNIYTNTIAVETPNNIVQRNAAISLTNTDNALVSQNTITGNMSNSLDWRTSGIYTRLGVNNVYRCNTINATGLSMNFQGSCPSTIYRNSFNNASSNSAYVGIYSDNSGYTGPIGTMIPVAATKIMACNENTFGAFVGGDTYTLTNSIGSPIYYPGTPTASNTYYPAANFSIQTPYTPVMSSHTGYVHCDGEVWVQYSPGLAPFFSNILDFGPNTDNMVHISRKAIYELLEKENTTEEDIEGTGVFKNYMDNTVQKDFYQIDQQMINFMNTGDASVLAGAININDAVAPANAIDQNQKNFNSVYLQSMQAEDIQITESMLTTLRELAMKCPYTDGTSVYQARAVLRNYENTEYTNPCESSHPEESLVSGPATGVKEHFNTSGTLIYPNPAQNEFMVQTQTENAEIAIYNLLGQAVLTKGLNTATHIDISHLTNATYVYKIRKGQEVIKTDKLIICR